MGIPAYVLTTYTEGESKDYGTFMASVAKEIVKTGRPFKAPCFSIACKPYSEHVGIYLQQPDDFNPDKYFL